MKTLRDVLAELPEWIGMPPGTRALVTRDIGKPEDKEEKLYCVGFLRVGVEGQPDNRIYDHLGQPTEETMKPGDFIDGMHEVKRWHEQGLTIQKAIPADRSANEQPKSEPNPPEVT